MQQCSNRKTKNDNTGGDGASDEEKVGADNSGGDGAYSQGARLVAIAVEMPLTLKKMKNHGVHLFSV